jgi:hypothetical protein
MPTCLTVAVLMLDI